MPAEVKMQKYLFKAHAVALRGSIRKPYAQDLGEHLAIATHAGASCHTESNNRNFALGEDVKYDAAHTEIIAASENGIHRTTLISRVEGLKIGKRLEVDEVTCRFQSAYDSREYPRRCLPRILPVGSTIKNLRIDGRVQELHLPTAFIVDQKTLDSFLLGERDNDPALQPGAVPEPIHVKDFGTIFYAEWAWVHPKEHHQQSLTMVRMALGSDLGADIDAGSGSSDGTGWPPTS